MFKPSKTAIICASALSLLAASAPAGFAEDNLEIRNFIGTINWSNGAMSAAVEKNGGETKVSQRESVIVDGGQDDIDGSDCKSTYGKFNIDLFGKKKQGSFGGYKNLEDLPVLNISVPTDTRLFLRDSIVFTNGAPNFAEADVAMRHCGELSLGDVAGLLALDSRGSADVSVGSTGQLVANLKGSGDLEAGNTGDVVARSDGSGDFVLGDAGSLEMSLNGSGDIETGSVNGSVDLSSYGSGDAELGDVEGSLNYSGNGSGDLDVSSVKGAKLALESRGSGDIDIGGGQVDAVHADVRGSGGIAYSGKAGAANLSTYGSGDIRVDRVTGAVEMNSRGSGDVKVSNRG